MEPVTSTNDAKEYKYITLDNKLQVLLVSNLNVIEKFSGSSSSDEQVSSNSDPDSSDVGRSHRAAACLTVGVGSFCDSDQVLGLAHYVEHMLFMGSEKYPAENDFEAYLSAHGGYSNGATDNEVTSFFFQVGSRYFEQALDMFAQFFISPLFQEIALERELCAVESEYTQAKQCDRTRLQQVMCTLVEEPHPYRRFSWGNRKSLHDLPRLENINVREKVIEFYERYYSANIMKLVVCSDEAISDLEEWVRRSFDAIPNRNVAPISFPSLALSMNDRVCRQHQLCRVVSIHDINLLQIGWFISPIFAEYRIRPADYIATLLGHEGQGSLLALLKERAWATALEAGVDETDGYSCGTFGAYFGIQMTLTAKGVRNWEKVVRTIFEYLHLLRTNGFREWIFDELKSLSETAFLLHEEIDEIDLCQDLSLLMQDMFQVQRSDLLRYHVFQGEFRRDIVESILKQLNVFNAHLILSSRSMDLDGANKQIIRQEEWFDIEYQMQDIRIETIDSWACTQHDERLRLPQPNPFIPTDFALLPHISEATQIQSTLSDSGRFWLCTDTVFHSPKASFVCRFVLPNSYRSVQAYVCTDLFTRCVRDRLTETAYQASVAGLSYSLRHRMHGLELFCTGYSDKLTIFVQKILATLHAFCISLSRFSLIKEEAVRDYRNTMIKAGKKAKHLATLALHHECYDPHAILAAAKDTGYSDLKEFVLKELWQANVYCSGLAHGNISTERAIKLWTFVDELMRAVSAAPEPIDHPLLKAVLFPASISRMIIEAPNENDQDTNSAVVVIYQVMEDSLETRAYAELLMQIMEEPLFDGLRTKQGLGYDVNCGIRYIGRMMCLQVFVESGTYSASFISGCIDAFMNDFDEALIEVCPENFEAHVQALIDHKMQRDHNLYEKSSRLWDQIRDGRFQFDLNEEMARVLESCTREKLLELFRCWMIRNPRRLYVQVQSQVESKLTDNGHHGHVLSVEDLNAFRKEQNSYSYSITKSDLME